MTAYTFDVVSVTPLQNDVFQVVLRGDIPFYHAGQYLEVVLPSGEASAFSIASAPTQHQQELALHILKHSDNAKSTALFKAFDTGSVQVKMPKGSCYIEYVDEQPLVLVAAGTGFAQMKSICDYALLQPNHGKIHFYWGNKNADGFYFELPPMQLTNDDVHFHAVVDDLPENGDWSGRKGFLLHVLVEDYAHLKDAQIYISGSPQMVYATMDALVSHGFDPKQFHSDVFAYAPR